MFIFPSNLLLLNNKPTLKKRKKIMYLQGQPVNRKRNNTQPYFRKNKISLNHLRSLNVEPFPFSWNGNHSVFSIVNGTPVFVVKDHKASEFEFFMKPRLGYGSQLVRVDKSTSGPNTIFKIALSE